MKTIGIITTFRQPNWGSVLQAYALQKVLDDMGYEAWLIDYRYPNDFHYARGIRKPRSWWRNLPGNIKNRMEVVLGRAPENKMILLNRFIRQEMRVTRWYESYDDLHQNPPQFDIYIAGSDQIWNPKTMLCDMSYLLDFAPETAKKFSYASSFSGVSIPESYKPDYQKHMNRLSAISVREHNGAKVVNELLGRDAEVVLDPTLLLDRNHWMQIAERATVPQLPEKFILCYMLGYTYRPDKAMCGVLHQLQKQYEMPVVALNALPSDFHGEVFSLPRNYGIGAEEFLYLISRATIVASSSFHGTAFALNFGKPMVAVADIRQENDDRLTSLLRRLNLTCLIQTTEDNTPIPFYDFEMVQTRLCELRAKSMTFLTEMVKIIPLPT